MVFREEYASQTPADKADQLALPTDRLTAVILDMAFLLPIITLILAPLQRQIYMHRILSEYWGVSIFYILSIVVAGSVGMIYQSWFWYRLSATPGQLLMGLRIRSVFQSKLSLHQCLFRSFSWWLNCIAIGIPFLSVYSHRMRKPFHDRLAETEVYSVRGRATRPANTTEQVLFSTLQSIGSTFVMFTALFMVSVIAGTLSSPGAVGEFFYGKSLGCSQIASGLEDLKEVESKATRLTVAMALYASDELSLECLEKEAQNDLWFSNESDKSLAYLAMAFVKMDNPELSNSYYEQVCAGNSDSSPCKLSQLMVEFEKPRTGWSRVALENSEYDYSTRIWAVRFANRMGLFAKALEIIDSIYVIPELAKFIGEQRVKALNGLQRVDESEMVLAEASKILSFEKRSRLFAWHCHEQMQKNCGADQNSCRQLKVNVKIKPEVLGDELVSLTMFRLRECSQDENELEGMEDSNSALRFANAYKKMNEEDNITPMRLLAFERNDSPYVLEARVRLAKRTTEVEDIDRLTELWKKSREVGHIWDRQAMNLIYKNIENNQLENSLSIAEMYVQSRPIRGKSIERFVADLKVSQTKEQKVLKASLLKRVIMQRSPAGSFK